MNIVRCASGINCTRFGPKGWAGLSRSFAIWDYKPDPVLPNAQGWVPESRRTGLIASKMGMMGVWDTQGKRVVCTVLRIENCQVIQVKNTMTKKGMQHSLQVGGGRRNPKRVQKSMLVHCMKAGVKPKRMYKEFFVSENALLPPGTRITARHFVPGQYVDVWSRSKGKGFAGVMKKFGFKGQRQSHGTNKTHRQMGSTGQCQTPGKVWKGKKMPGRMGGNKQVTRSLLLYKIDVEKDLLFVKGPVPGPVKVQVAVADALYKRFIPECAPPYPTYFLPEGETEPFDEIVMDISHHDDPTVYGQM